MVSFLQKTKLGGRLAYLKNRSHFENPTPQSCNDRIPVFKTTRENLSSRHVKAKAFLSDQAKTQYGKCIDVYHTVKDRYFRSAGVTPHCVSTPYENNAVSSLTSDVAQENQHCDSDSSACALTDTSLYSAPSTCCTDATSLLQTLPESDFDRLPLSTVRAYSESLPKNEQVTTSSFAIPYPVLKCKTNPYHGQSSNLLTINDSQHQLCATDRGDSLSIKSSYDTESMTLAKKSYEKYVPLHGHKKARSGCPGSIEFLKAILKALENRKIIQTSHSIDTYKSLIKDVYGLDRGSQLINCLEADVDQVSPFLMNQLKKDQGNGLKHQSEIAMTYPVTKASYVSTDRLATDVDQDEYADKFDDIPAINAFDKSFVDISQVILVYIKRQHQFTTTQQAHVYRFLDAFVLKKVSGPTNNPLPIKKGLLSDLAQNKKPLSKKESLPIKKGLLSDLAQNKKPLSKKEKPEIKTNIINHVKTSALSLANSETRKQQQQETNIVNHVKTSAPFLADSGAQKQQQQETKTNIINHVKTSAPSLAESGTRKRQQQEQCHPVLKHRRKNGQTSDLSEHSPATIDKLCKTPCDINTGQQIKRKRDHDSLEPSQQKRQKRQQQHVIGSNVFISTYLNNAPTLDLLHYHIKAETDKSMIWEKTNLNLVHAF
ncbi:hypothetical protein BCR42DRAFT_457042 [Absidia repens]|uniref:Uncharacterized protein n=1 Tax=Absidia repens TaxID=90262 RepID=A0A1X2HXR5_9FUNG|nr:hypothetical protein BCR42DRAFT_457042 [Absidia repens]